MLFYHRVFVRNWDVNILDVDGICIYTKIHRSMCSCISTCISRMIHWRTLTWDGNAIVADYINKEIPNSIEGKCKLIANSSCLTINPIFWRQKGRQKNLHIIAFSHFRRSQTSTKKKNCTTSFQVADLSPIYIHFRKEAQKQIIQAGTHKYCGDSTGLVQRHVMSWPRTFSSWKSLAPNLEEEAGTQLNCDDIIYM